MTAHFVMSNIEPAGPVSPALSPNWVRHQAATYHLTHVYQVGVSGGDTILQSFNIDNLYQQSVVGQRVLVNVPLGQLKKVCKQFLSSRVTAFFLVPAHARFHTCSAALHFLSEFAPAQVYQCRKPSFSSPVRLCCTNAPTNQVRAFSVGSGGVLMQFDVFLGGGKQPPVLPCSALLDSGATHCFIEQQLADSLKVTLLPSPLRSISLADGSSSPLTGTCSIIMSIQGVLCQVNAYVAKSLPKFPLILGNDWLLQVGATLDYKNKRCVLQSDTNSTILYPSGSPGFHAALLSAMTLPSLSPKEAKRMCGQSAVSFTCYISAEEALDCDTICLPPEDPPSPIVWPVDLPPVVDKVVRAAADVFAPSLTRMPTTESGSVIPLIPGSKPPKLRPYRFSPIELAACQKEVQAGLKNGTLVPSQSPFAAPVHFVTKKDGSLRMVFDYKALNAITVKQHFPLPRVDDILDHLGNCTVFSSLDLTSAYSQLKLPEEEVERTAFVVPFGQFASRVVTFGLTNAPSAFSSVMTKLFGSLIGKFIMVYLDDILVFSKSTNDHADHLSQVFAILRKHDLKAKLSKCLFCKPQVEYLGHLVGAQGLSVNPKKVAAVTNWPVPLCVKDLQAFLGLCNYFRRFLPCFGQLPLPSMHCARRTWPGDGIIPANRLLT